MAARQQNAQGEILLIHPFSLVFLCWLGVGISAAILGFLFLGHTTQTQRIEGTVTATVEVDSVRQPQAVFLVPQPQQVPLQPGRELLVRCDTCTEPLAGKITSISRPASSESGQSPSNHSYSTVTVALPRDVRIRPGATVEAEIQLGRKSLMAWLVQKPGP